MLLRKTSNNKEFKNDNLHEKVVGLNATLTGNYGKDLAVTNKVLDELYQIILFCLENENKAALLEAAESLKLAYGLAWDAKKIREDEYLYWREVVLATLANGEFQAVEYLLESSKNLLKIFTDKRDAIVETMKMIADMAMREKKFFIAAAIIDIFLYRLNRLEKENKKTASAIIGCVSSIGAAALKGGDSAFFKEISALLCQNVTKVAEFQEIYWDNLIVSWLNVCFKQNAYRSYDDWKGFFYSYRQLRPGVNQSFYAEIVDLTVGYVLQMEDGLLQELYGDLLKYTWLKTSYIECILSLQAFNKALARSISIVGWEKAVYLFKPFFMFCFHLSNRYDKKDELTALSHTVLQIGIEGINQAVAFVVIDGEHNGTLPVLYKWREYFLFRSRSPSAAKVIKGFWQRCADYWEQNNAGRITPTEQELLFKFHE